MDEAVGFDSGIVDHVVDDLLASAGRLPSLSPVRSFPALPEPGDRVVAAVWYFDEVVAEALAVARTQCRVAAATLRILASDVHAADRW